MPNIDPNDNASPTPLDRRDFLWKVIGRFDFYIGTTNNKATFLIAYNAFVVTSLVFKWNDLLQMYGVSWMFLSHLTSILLALIAITSLVSLGLVFQAVNPFLQSPKDPEDYHSLMFFGHVAEYKQPAAYLSKVAELEESKALKDLAYQAHTLACATATKFKWIKKSVGTILFVQLPLCAILIASLLFFMIASRYNP